MVRLMNAICAIDPVVLFFKSFEIHWHGIFIALAIGAAIVAAVLLGEQRGLTRSQVYGSALCSLALGFVLSRLGYVFFFLEAFRNDGGLLFRFWEGGYSLLGGIAGVVLSLLICARRMHYRLSDMLDVAAIGGALAIGIGRLGGLFSRENIGVTIQSEKWQCFPFAVYIPETDSWSLALMLFEAVFAFAIFAVLLAVDNYAARPAGRRIRSGDIALLFMLLYGIVKTQLESMRVDALYLNTLGFVKIMEVCAIIAAVCAIVVFSVRSVRVAGRVQLWHCAAWVIVAQALTVSMYAELRISAETMVPFYSMMAVELSSIICCGVVLYRHSIFCRVSRERT